MIVFNGEIYNYRALRDDLVAHGYIFRSTSDTEVLLALYERKGAKMLQELRGMYAFAIWDMRKRQLFLARDPYGIKPLYYANDGSTFMAASQVKALLVGGGIDTSPEPAGHAGFFLWGHVPEPYTLYRGIRAVPAGASIVVDCDGTVREHRFTSIPEAIATAFAATESGSTQREETLSAALHDSVRSHLVADVPVGLFLSAGLDSTSIAALAADLGRQMHSVTLGFEEYRGTEQDETPLAERIAHQFGFRHDTVWVRRQQFEEERERLFEAMDQPSIDGVNSWFVSKAAAATGMKVALSGLGGDELFGGYPSFSQIPRSRAALRLFGKTPALGRALRVLVSPVVSRMTSPKYASLAEYGGSWGGAYLLRRALFLPWELPRVMDQDMAAQGLRELRTLDQLATTEDGIADDHGKLMALESCWYMRNQLLRDIDWASMAHSLEVRVPFVDLELARAVRAIGGSGAPVSKQEVSRVSGRSLPDALRKRSKSGFTVPIRDWHLQSSSDTPDRGLRGWARSVYETSSSSAECHSPGGAVMPLHRGLRIAALLTDGFGARGGIAQYSRDLLEVVCNRPDVARVAAFPRHAPDPLGRLPAVLSYCTDGISGKGKYLRSLLAHRNEFESADLILCGHINLLPAAWALKRRFGAPIILFIYGVDAWQPVGGFPVMSALRSVDAIVSISRITLDRFLSWAPVSPARCGILPNAVHLECYGTGLKDADLVRKYRLEGKRVLMTVGRIVSKERGKGFDEVLDVLPRLTTEYPDVVYMVVGEGEGLPRLRRRAAQLGVEKQVIFTDYVPEEQKTEHYRLADVYVMPSRGEGFGFVFLEAMACGIPVVASTRDGSREAVRDGELGLLVDPDSPEQIAAAIRKALAMPKKVPDGLSYFAAEAFSDRLNAIFDKTLRGTKEQAA